MYVLVEIKYRNIIR